MREWYRPIRFMAVGVLNTLVGLSIIYFCKFALGMADLPANAAGYAVGLAVSFWGNASWTFEYRGKLAPTVMRYLIVFAIAYGANLASLFFLKSMGLNSYVAQAASILPYMATFYILSKVFVFAGSRST